MRLLVVKHGGLAGVVVACQAFSDIRAHHGAAHVTLLTTAPFTFLRRSPWFDRVVADQRPPPWRVGAVAALRRELAGFDLVYDLQGDGRTTLYRWLAGRPGWHGAARGARLWDMDPASDALHGAERDRALLAAAGVPCSPPAAMEWLARDAPAVDGATTVANNGPFALLVPGATPFRPGRRWPVERFGTLAAALWAHGVTPMVLGSPADGPLAAIIQEVCPAALDLTARLAPPQVAGLAAAARMAVGNDTGLMNVAAAMGCPSVVLVAEECGPAVTLPRGPAVTVLRVPSLADLAAERVAAALP